MPGRQLGSVLGRGGAGRRNLEVFCAWRTFPKEAGDLEQRGGPGRSAGRHRAYGVQRPAEPAGARTAARLLSREALAGHPRVGEAPAAGQSSRSRSEQAGVDRADGTVRAELAAGNRAYEERFGRIYLVCASGRSAQELLSILQDRLRNDPATERQVVRAELGKINDLRLARLMGARERAS